MVLYLFLPSVGVWTQASPGTLQNSSWKQAQGIDQMQSLISMQLPGWLFLFPPYFLLHMMGKLRLTSQEFSLKICITSRERAMPVRVGNTRELCYSV